MRGIDFLARHAHHESFEYPLGSFRGGAIQRPLKEMCNEEEEEEEEGDRAADDSQESTDDVPVLASAANGRQEPPESLYPYLVVCGKECYSSALFFKCLSFWGCYVLQVAFSTAYLGKVQVNIGSGVSILRVDNAEKFERVGGTSLGGRLIASTFVVMYQRSSM